MSIVLSCPARRQSSHYLSAEAPPCWCEVRPVAAGSVPLLGSPPAATGYALRQSLSLVAGRLGNGSLRQQWECTSVGAGCLGNGKCPSPTKLHRPGFSCALSETLHPEHFESPFCLSQYPGPNSISLESSCLAHCPSPVQSDGYAICPLKSQISGSTGHPDQCALCRALWSTAALQHRPPAAPAKTALLASHVSFIPGNFPVLWATKIHLEMRP